MEWENIKVVLYTMENGQVILEMDGVYFKIKLLDIVMSEVGNKIESMDLADSKIWPLYMKDNFTKIKNKGLES